MDVQPLLDGVVTRLACSCSGDNLVCNLVATTANVSETFHLFQAQSVVVYATGLYPRRLYNSHWSNPRYTARIDS